MVYTNYVWWFGGFFFSVIPTSSSFVPLLSRRYDRERICAAFILGGHWEYQGLIILIHSRMGSVGDSYLMHTLFCNPSSFCIFSCCVIIPLRSKGSESGKTFGHPGQKDPTSPALFQEYVNSRIWHHVYDESFVDLVRQLTESGWQASLSFWSLFATEGYQYHDKPVRNDWCNRTGRLIVWLLDRSWQLCCVFVWFISLFCKT